MDTFNDHLIQILCNDSSNLLDVDENKLNFYYTAYLVPSIWHRWTHEAWRPAKEWHDTPFYQTKYIQQGIWDYSVEASHFCSCIQSTFMLSFFSNISWNICKSKRAKTLNGNIILAAKKTSVLSRQYIKYFAFIWHGMLGFRAGSSDDVLDRFY